MLEVFFVLQYQLSMLVVGGMVELGVGSPRELGGGVSLFGQLFLRLNFARRVRGFSLILTCRNNYKVKLDLTHTTPACSVFYISFSFIHPFPFTTVNIIPLKLST
jgi:hypothetical protein